MEWLRTYHAQHFLDHPVICFVSKQEYPFLFFSLFLRRLAQDYTAISYYNVQQLNDTLYAQLETSFLGLPRICWLGSLESLSKEQTEKWQRYISTYNGPNYILYTSSLDQKVASTQKVVYIKEEMSKKDFNALFSFFVRSIRSYDLERIDQIHTTLGAIPLDAACLLLQYLQVTGPKDHEFMDSWLQRLITPQQSLFNISQYFFAKDRASFLAYWSDIKHAYTEQFWIAFFSDQLWRASFYCKYMKDAKWNEAKAIGFRLPFSFLQKDYKKLTFHELCNAHNWLYQCDYAIKNGAHTDRIDLFFYHFFAGYYQKAPV